MNGKVVNSHCPEFGYELLSALPYAYNLYLKGNLQETISSHDTKCLYFFSPKHTETDCKRSWDNMKVLWNEKFPNINIHRNELDWHLFSPPPLKKHYESKKIQFKKETLVIFNRINKEWGGPPINFLDIPTLDKLFNLLSEKFQVVYINLNKDEKYFDHAHPIEFDENSVLAKYPKVKTIYDISKDHPESTINELQLRLFANCSKYISSNGGQLILSAYFGGENIIFSKKCRELDPKTNSFYKWYHKLGGGIFQHVNNYDDLVTLVKQKWVDDKPLINILVRTSDRPNYFDNCVKSIYSQTYKNWNLIIGVDNKNSEQYAQSAKGRTVKYNYSNYQVPKQPNNDDYGIPFVYNLYFNDLHKEITSGYVLYLDDDDKLYSKDSLEKIVNNIKGEDDLLFWRVKFPNRLVPSDINFGKAPVIRDIDTIGFVFHHKYIQNWTPYKRGDYRVSKKLYDIIPNKKYINEILTSLQRENEDGFGLKDDLKKNKNDKSLSVIIPTFDNVEFLDECFNSILNSIKDLNCEILVGVDSCKKTLNFLKTKKFDSRFKFMFFDERVGPYVIRNTLVDISRSEKILFFDSDDIMLPEMVQDALYCLDSFKIFKPMYLDSENPKIDMLIERTRKYGEGVFGIQRSLFFSLNGFEGWMCAADSDFMSRAYSKNVSIYMSKNVVFLRRIHRKSLTVNPETNYSSKLRAHYYGLSKKIRPSGKCLEFKVANSFEVDVEYNEDEKNEIFLQKKREFDNFMNNVLNIQANKKGVDYHQINKIQEKKGVYNPKTSNKPIRENIPNKRQELINKKKDSLSSQVRTITPGKPNRRNNLPNIF